MLFLVLSRVFNTHACTFERRDTHSCNAFTPSLKPTATSDSVMDVAMLVFQSQKLLNEVIGRTVRAVFF